MWILSKFLYSSLVFTGMYMCVNYTCVCAPKWLCGLLKYINIIVFVWGFVYISVETPSTNESPSSSNPAVSSTCATWFDFMFKLTILFFIIFYCYFKKYIAQILVSSSFAGRCVYRYVVFMICSYIFSSSSSLLQKKKRRHDRRSSVNEREAKHFRKVKKKKKS